MALTSIYRYTLQLLKSSTGGQAHRRIRRRKFSYWQIDNKPFQFRFEINKRPHITLENIPHAAALMTRPPGQRPAK